MFCWTVCVLTCSSGLLMKFLSCLVERNIELGLVSILPGVKSFSMISFGVLGRRGTSIFIALLISLLKLEMNKIYKHIGIYGKRISWFVVSDLVRS